jgi:hypothetical protein
MPRSAHYPVTASLSVGPFVSPERAPVLVASGITDLLNVSDSRNWPEITSAGFRSISWIPIADCVPIDGELVTEALTRLDELFTQPGARVLVHCLAGQNRSPTMIWLYLRSLGVNANVAKSMIEAASPDAVGGHPLLLSPETIDAMVGHRFGRTEELSARLRKVVLGESGT